MIGKSIELVSHQHSLLIIAWLFKVPGAYPLPLSSSCPPSSIQALLLYGVVNSLKPCRHGRRTMPSNSGPVSS
jgi:hypothetical protein